jgi:hypothetical protein
MADGPVHNEVSKALKACDTVTEFLQITAIWLAVEKRESKCN